MVSDASKKKAAQKKAATAAKRGGKAAAASSKTSSSEKPADRLADGIGEIQISDRTCTGVLCSHPLSRDIRVSTGCYTFTVEYSVLFLSMLITIIMFCLSLSIWCFGSAH